MKFFTTVVLFSLTTLAFTAEKKEKKFADIKAWFDDIESRKKTMDDDIKPQDTDDPQTLNAKRQAQSHLNVVQRLISERKTQLSQQNNLQAIGTMRTIEAHMSASGRALYGTKWNEAPCGPGMMVANCGSNTK